MKTWTNIGSLGHFLETVSIIGERWTRPKNKELWFRAEDAAHRSTCLQPGLYRSRENEEGQKPVQDLLDLEQELYEEFGRCAAQLSPSDSGAIEDDWNSYFLMQHHGVPTRILDWTDGSLVSLHFALRNKQLIPMTDSVVYVLDPYWLIDILDSHEDQAETIQRWKAYCGCSTSKDIDDEDWDRLYLPFGADSAEQPLLNMPRIPLLWDSPHLTRRIAAQRSRFLIFGTERGFLTRVAEREEARLEAIEISKSAIPRIRRELRDAGIVESVVFPDLDGLGRELKQKWELER